LDWQFTHDRIIKLPPHPERRASRCPRLCPNHWASALRRHEEAANGPSARLREYQNAELDNAGLDVTACGGRWRAGTGVGAITPRPAQIGA